MDDGALDPDLADEPLAYEAVAAIERLLDLRDGMHVDDFRERLCGELKAMCRSVRSEGRDEGIEFFRSICHQVVDENDRTRRAGHEREMAALRARLAAARARRDADQLLEVTANEPNQ